MCCICFKIEPDGSDNMRHCGNELCRAKWCIEHIWDGYGDSDINTESFYCDGCSQLKNNPLLKAPECKFDGLPFDESPSPSPAPDQPINSSQITSSSPPPPLLTRRCAPANVSKKKLVTNLQININNNTKNNNKNNNNDTNNNINNNTKNNNNTQNDNNDVFLYEPPNAFSTKKKSTFALFDIPSPPRLFHDNNDKKINENNINDNSNHNNNNNHNNNKTNSNNHSYPIHANLPLQQINIHQINGSNKDNEKLIDGHFNLSSHS